MSTIMNNETTKDLELRKRELPQCRSGAYLIRKYCGYETLLASCHHHPAEHYIARRVHPSTERYIARWHPLGVTSLGGLSASWYPITERHIVRRSLQLSQVFHHPRSCPILLLGWPTWTTCNAFDEVLSRSLRAVIRLLHAVTWSACFDPPDNATVCF